MGRDFYLEFVRGKYFFWYLSFEDFKFGFFFIWFWGFFFIIFIFTRF